jgi:hypothetical protein
MEFIWPTEQIGLDFLRLIQINCARRREVQDKNARQGDQNMFDATMIVAGLAFFVVAVGYVFACDRL